MVGLWTTYLSWLRKADYNPIKIFPDALEPTEILYVMRKRGNDVVAPSETLLSDWKNRKITWQVYIGRYYDWLYKGNGKSIKWMKRVGERAKVANVVLVCYEKDAKHCHRLLLALATQKWSGCEYKGELTEECLKSVREGSGTK